jgi:hypothetical protein
MLNDAGIDGKFRNGIWAECESTATFYEDIITIYVDDCLVIGTDEGIDNIINNLRC